MEQSNKKPDPERKKPPCASRSVRELRQRVSQLIAASALVSPGKALIIAVSGGSDSIALLHLLSTIFPAIPRVAVYVDHGLRPHETPGEISLVEKMARKCSAHFRTVAVDVARESSKKRISTEDAARKLRYQALEGVREEFQAQSIAVGHTADDQAEEILLRLIRGSGCTGLSGMRLQRGTIIRPLLHEKKATLLTYLKEQKIPFCQDSSNLDTRFLRNKIRLDLLPKLENDYNPAMRETLLQTASILHEEDRLLQTITDKAYHGQIREESVPSANAPGGKKLFLTLQLFTSEHPAIQRRVLEKICWNMGSRPSFKKITNLLSLTASQHNGEIHLAQGLRACKDGTLLFFHHPVGKSPYRGPSLIKKSFSPLTIPAPGNYPVPELNRVLLLAAVQSVPEYPAAGQLYLDPSDLHYPLVLRQPLPGDRFHPLGAPGSKKVSRFLSDQKIPAAMRDSYPILLSNKQIVAIAGLRIDHHFRLSGGEQKALLVQWKRMEE